jgi:hypothetical protein
MTGYLQRMAENARSPGRSIRPLLGSIFAPADGATASQTPGLEDVLVAADGPAAAARPSADTRPPSPAPRSISSTSDAGPVVPYEPLIAEPARPAHKVEPLRPARQVPSDGVPAAQRAVQDKAEPGDRLMQLPADAVLPARPAQTSLDVVETVGAAHPVGSIARPPHSSGAWAEPRAPAAFSLAKPRGPIRDVHPAARPGDDIQIHIGRIEVTAVRPAPAPQPAARTRRGAPSLDDYLKRRDGRAP